MLDLSKSKNFLGDIQNNSSEKLNFFWLGSQSYKPIWNLQKEIHDLVKKEKLNDIFLLLEHEHVYTLGKNANSDHLLPSYPKEADVVKIDRGGEITYHGPGQLVGYPIINLSKYRKSVSWYMRVLEQIIMDSLDKIGLLSHRKQDLTGVWVDDAKICAMGVRLSRWITMHGFALNFNPEMRFFDGMIPCGIFEFGVTSIAECIDIEIQIFELAEIISQTVKEKFSYDYLERQII